MSGTKMTGGSGPGAMPKRSGAAATAGPAFRGAPVPVRSTESVGPAAGPAPVAAGAVARPPGPRKARVYVTRVDPWSVMKAGFMLALVVAVILLVMVAALWWVLDVTGVFEALARNVDEIVGGGTATFDLQNFIGFSRVMGVATVVAAMEIVLVSILATLFAFGYNLTVGITGGIEVTLSDD